VDLYRLTPGDTGDLGLEEMGVADGVLAIEWPERLRAGFPRASSVRLATVDGAGESMRRITIDAL
jgi:tRNA A37 threonylcarbamoyladenosine biosynthesis protein TsaE